MLVPIYQNTRRRVREDAFPNIHGSEFLKLHSGTVCEFFQWLFWRGVTCLRPPVTQVFCRCAPVSYIEKFCDILPALLCLNS